MVRRLALALLGAALLIPAGVAAQSPSAGATWPTGQELMDTLTENYGYPWTSGAGGLGAVSLKSLDEFSTMMEDTSVALMDGMIGVSSLDDVPQVIVLYGALGNGQRHAERVLEILAPDRLDWFGETVSKGSAWESAYTQVAEVPQGTITVSVDPKVSLITMDITPTGYVKPTPPPPVRVPDVQCKTYQEAKAILEEAGLTVGLTTTPRGYTVDSPGLVVWFQSLVAGKTADRGAEVQMMLMEEC